MMKARACTIPLTAIYSSISSDIRATFLLLRFRLILNRCSPEIKPPTPLMGNIRTGKKVYYYTEAKGGIRSVPLSRVEKFVIPVRNTATHRLWNTDYQDFIVYGCQHVYADFTVAER